MPPGHLLLVVLSAGCAAPGASPPGDPLAVERTPRDGLVVEVREAYYGVRGDTPSALNGALAVAAPRHRGRRAYGLTDWVVRWRYRTLPESRACRIGEPEIRVTLTTRLPRWEDRERAARRISADWELFLARLRAHEAGHRALVIREASGALDALRALAAPTCDGLRRRAEEVIRRVEDRMWEGHREYDRSTRYGLSQTETPAGR